MRQTPRAQSHARLEIPDPGARRRPTLLPANITELAMVHFRFTRYGKLASLMWNPI